MKSQIPLDLPHGNIKVFLNTGFFEVNIELFNQVLECVYISNAFSERVVWLKERHKKIEIYINEIWHTLFTVKNAKLVLKPRYLFYLLYRKLKYALCSKLDIYAFCC